MFAKLSCSLPSLWSSAGHSVKVCSCLNQKHYGSFTLATFVSETAGDSDTQHHLTVLALATLGGTTQIGLFLFMSHCPRWPRQVSSDCYCRWHYQANFRQWKHGFRVGCKCCTVTHRDTPESEAIFLVVCNPSMNEL
jgi:hypothetical protein